MNEWGTLHWLASVLAVFSVPLVLFALLMRLVGRIGRRTLSAILVADAVLWAMAAVFWALPSCVDTAAERQDSSRPGAPSPAR
jgi:hypothetical protein